MWWGPYPVHQKGRPAHGSFIHTQRGSHPHPTYMPYNYIYTPIYSCTHPHLTHIPVCSPMYSPTYLCTHPHKPNTYIHTLTMHSPTHCHSFTAAHKTYINSHIHSTHPYSQYAQPHSRSLHTYTCPHSYVLSPPTYVLRITYTYTHNHRNKLTPINQYKRKLEELASAENLYSQRTTWDSDWGPVTKPHLMCDRVPGKLHKWDGGGWVGPAPSTLPGQEEGPEVL